MNRKLLFLVCVMLAAFRALASEDGVHYTVGKLKYELINSQTARTQQGFDDNAFHSYGNNCIDTQSEYYYIPGEIVYGDQLKVAKVTQIGILSFVDCWFIERISIGENVKSIGTCAFKNCTGLKTVYIPENVTAVGDRAFSGCTSLTRASFGNDALETLSSGLFENCSSLESVLLPGAVKTIRNSFFGCISLRAVYLPPSLQNLSSNAFEGCDLAKVAVPEGLSFSAPSGCYVVYYPRSSSVFKSNGYIISQDQTKIYCFDDPETGVTVIPENVERLGDYAGAALRNVEEVVIPESMTDMGRQTFRSCGKLRTVKTSAKVPPTGQDLFDASTMANGTLYVPVGSREAYMASDAWKDWANIVEYTVVKSIEVTPGDFSIKNNRRYQLSAKTYPEDASCQNLTWTSSNEDVISIDENGQISTLQEGTATITCTSSGDTWVRSQIKVTVTPTYIMAQNGYFDVKFDEPEEGVFKASIKNYIQTLNPDPSYIEIPSTITYDNREYPVVELEDNSFGFRVENYSITKIKIPDSVIRIGNSAFMNLTNLQSVEIPSSVKKIGTFAFWGCYGLTKADFANIESLCGIEFGDVESNPMFYTEELYIGGEKVTDVIIPETVTEIGSYAFTGCKNLKSVSISNPKTYIESSAFCLCNIDHVEIPEGTILKASFSSCKINSVLIHPGVQTLSSSPFSRSTIVKIAYPTSMERPVGDKTIEIRYPEEVTIENGLVYSAEEFYFAPTVLEGALKIPASVTSIADGAFLCCSNLSSIELPESLKTIGNKAFYECTSLNPVVIPAQVTSIGESAFSECTSMESLDLPESLETIGNSAFFKCTGLKSVAIPSKVTSIGESAFESCISMESLDLPESLETIGTSVFSGCSNLKSVVIPSKVTSIGRSAFSGCRSMASLDLPESLKRINSSAFFNCSSLKSVVIPPQVTFIIESAFEGCTSLESIDLPESLSSIDDRTFYGCTSLKSVVLPNGVTIVGDSAFEGCSSLQSVTLGVKIFIISTSAFRNCNIEEIIIPNEGRLYIMAYAFYGSKIKKMIFGPNEISDEYHFADSNESDIYTTAATPNYWYLRSTNGNHGTLYVQDDGDNAVIDAYKNANWWNSFAEYKAMKVISEFKAEKQDFIYHMPGQKIQLNASVYPEDATLPYIFWSTSNSKVATVDHNGLVRINRNLADTDQECVITARTLYRDVPELTFTIRPADVLFDKFSIQEIGQSSIEAGDDIQLITNPDNLQSQDATFEWSTSDPQIASVDQNGVVSGWNSGTVEISVTMAFEDGFKVSDTKTLKVNPALTGDSNLDHGVSITDAVCTANYAIGNEVKRFSVEAADVDKNDRITIADVTGTVSIILDGAAPAQSFAADMLLKSVDFSADRLEIDDYAPDASSILAVRLGSGAKYVAMQADITLPDGMEIEEIVAGEGMSRKHSLAYRAIDDRHVRVVIFDPSNHKFTNGGEPLMYIKVKTDSFADEDLLLSNILVADADAREYRIADSRSQKGTTSSVVSELGSGQIEIETSDHKLTVKNAKGHDVMIYSLNGICISTLHVESDMDSVALGEGIYLVKVADEIRKVIVK